MRYGKLGETELAELLKNFKFSRGEVIKGAAVGADTAVIRSSDYILVTTDPITAAVENVGELAVDINANDIYASMGEPFAAVMTVLAPPDASPNMVLEQIRAAYDKAACMNIAIIGGHSEFTDAVNRLVISLTMLGSAQRLIDNSSITRGDKVIVTKSLGIEGAKIIVDMYRKESLSILSIDQMEELDALSLSVGKESKALHGCIVHALHDITEGGVAGACAEIAANSQYGILLYEELMPISSAAAALAEHYALNINYLISSGSMLIITPETEKVLQCISRMGIRATVVGEVIAGGSALVRNNGTKEPLVIKTDEIYKLYR